MQQGRGAKAVAGAAATAASRPAVLHCVQGLLRSGVPAGKVRLKTRAEGGANLKGYFQGLDFTRYRKRRTASIFDAVNHSKQPSVEIRRKDFCYRLDGIFNVAVW